MEFLGKIFAYIDSGKVDFDVVENPLDDNGARRLPTSIVCIKNVKQ